MARKKKAEPHENLERWLISYADFMTLLFATFVVLYALAQVDAKDFAALEQSLKEAFAAPSVMQGSEGLMDQGAKDIFDSAQGDSMIAPLMMEYMNPKYEDNAMNEMEKDINDAAKDGELDGIQAEKAEKGLLIRFKDDLLFAPSSAKINEDAKIKIDKVGVIIAKKFVLHHIRIEGHTDPDPIKSTIYPSNWELSSARASSMTRYLINRFKFLPNLFTVVGFADTRPLVSNTTPMNKARNRRVEIIILKNKYKNSENPVDSINKMSKSEQDAMQRERLSTINRIGEISEAAKKLTGNSKAAEENAVILNKVYNNEIKRISNESRVMEKSKSEDLTGQGGWLKPRSSSIKVFK